MTGGSEQKSPCSGCGGARRVGRGAVGLGKAAVALTTGRGRVGGDVFAERTAACRACDSWVERTNSCGECGCFIGPKALVASESCPRGVWKE